MALTFTQVGLVDGGVVTEFLSGNDWPFHGTTRLSVAQAMAVGVVGADVKSFLIVDDGVIVGLIRLLDLDDVEDGSPMFDLRIGNEHRGRGLGTAAVTWLSNHLFSSYAVLHRIEATTRVDNVAMRAVFERTGYHHEGTFREAWKNEDGSWSDTAAYAMLRSEWVVSANV
jgi:RimJ/RimL family protein N-acetyltransferase